MTPELESKKEETTHEKVPVLLSKRWILAYVGFFGFLAIQSLRVNLSVGIVCMVKDDNSTDNNSTNSTCSSDEKSGNTTNPSGEFEWDKTTQGLILSSFFFGYLGSNVLGGWLAGVFGARRVWGTGVFIASVATVLTPEGARYSYKMAIVLRVIMGLAQGVSFPSMHSMLGKWAPKKDRTKMASCIYSGQNMGYIVTYMISGALCDHGFDHGWGSIFYVTGGYCFVWVAAWFYLVADTPEQHPTITEAERNYIIAGRGKISHRDIIVPWLSIAKSRAMWMCLLAHISNNWLNYTLLTGLPSFMKEVLKYDIRQNSMLSGIPYLVMIFTMIAAGYAADFVRNRYLSTTYTRRIFQSIAFLGSGALIVAVGFIDCSNRNVAVVLLCLAVGVEGLCFSGYNVNQVDFAPRYAGVLMGITNMISTIPGILAPTVIGVLTPNKSQEEWRVVFYICGGMCLFGTLTFGCFASGELEPWAAVPEETVVEPPDALEIKSKQHDQEGQINAGFVYNEEVLNWKVADGNNVIIKM